MANAEEQYKAMREKYVDLIGEGINAI